jgi:hypothetical protein
VEVKGVKGIIEMFEKDIREFGSNLIAIYII